MADRQDSKNCDLKTFGNPDDLNHRRNPNLVGYRGISDIAFKIGGISKCFSRIK
jgi:hypothetical protein